LIYLKPEFDVGVRESFHEMRRTGKMHVVCTASYQLLSDVMSSGFPWALA